MALSDYKRDECITVDIDGEEIKFELPTRWNKVYTREWQKALEGNMTSDGVIKADAHMAMIVIEAQKAAFANCCITECPITSQELVDDYPMLLDAIYAAAQSLVEEQEARADALSKKLLHLSNGKGNGTAKLNSTIASSKKGELQPTI
jgi:hypothetical protein